MATAKETTNRSQPEIIEERDSLPRDLYVEQYSSLRSEIEKRLDIRQATLTFTLVLAGTFLSVAAQPGIAAATAFYYPVIALFLAAAWTHNDVKIGQISQYIKLEIEQHMLFTGWEAYRKATFDGTHPLTSKKGIDQLLDKRRVPGNRGSRAAGWLHPFHSGLACRSPARHDRHFRRPLRRWSGRNHLELFPAPASP